MKIVLFDIDGTILWSDGAGRRAMEGALTTVFGTVGPTGYRYDGKTDPQIVRELMVHAGFDEPDVDRRLPVVLEQYLGKLEHELATGERTVHLLEGVTELLAAVEAREDMVLGLLTGNVRSGAVLKLRAAGLDPDRFRVGAFGSDHHHRHELPGVARMRAVELLGRDVRGDRLVVIGDTPADISCGRSLGARAVAVATGRYSVEKLAACDPHAVFDTLRDTDAVMRVLIDA